MEPAAQRRCCSRRMRLHRATVVLALALLATGCARAMSVGSDAGPLYRITVHNDLGEAMIVSYNDGRGDALLGTVPARGTEHFAIGRPAQTAISVTARNSAGSRTAGPFSVTLTADAAQVVRLR